MSSAHLAIDLGASSGRAIVGVLEGDPQQLRLEEMHRFEHLPCPTPSGPVWDLTGIWQAILTGLREATAWCRENGADLKSVGVDTWGVDWTLVGKSGETLALPHCYRDPRHEGACNRVLEKLGGFEYLYERTGIQLMPLNTIFQVMLRHELEPKLFDAAERLLFLPDLLHFWLCGEMTTERTIASTSSMLAVESGDWDTELLEKLGLPTHILGPMIEPGTPIGELRSEVAEATGASKGIKVIAPASHDTGSAVAAVPATTERSWAYLSSGTWSLLGAELKQPLYSEQARAMPFTNERGVDRTIRFLKNIAGLWLVQELRRDLKRKGESRNFAELTQIAGSSEPFRTLVDPNFADFATPGNMIAKLCEFAKKTNQPEPETTGQLVRCCLESLAFCYRHTLSSMESVLGQTFDDLHVVGGGIKNTLLNEMTAAAVGRPVICGPIEATAIGNVLVQAMGCGEVADMAALRQIVARSSDLKRYAPGNHELDAQALARYTKITHQ
ncbi:MAG: rhamnulokinase [Planctomycetes bacterium]|nr:rhamnulokinase [Planctomycetota bacterium]